VTVALRPLEVYSRRTTLAIGFRDDVTGALVADGLRVALRAPHVAGRTATAVTNPRGIHVFHQLPGTADEADPGVSRPATFDLEDAAGRFMSYSFEAALPTAGLFVPACATSSPPIDAYAPLFSTPARSIPGGMAVVRAELFDATTGAPAVWALVSADLEGRELGRGVTDTAGRVVVIFPYPEPPPTSPPATRPWTWQIQLRASYSPVNPVPRVPSLCSVLSQRPARLRVDGSPAVDLPTRTLEFGRELIVTAGLAGRLVVEPA
jgi:hypothetical protein